MKNLFKNALGKTKVITTSIIVVMLAILVVSIIPLQSNGAETEDVDYVKFDANFESTTQGQEKFNVVSNTGIAVTYNIKLSGIPTGYQDLQLRVIDEESSTPRTSLPVYVSALYANKVIGDTLYFDGSVPSCTIQSTFYVQYDRTADFSEYDKNIKVLLTGTYLNPFTKQVESISKEQTLAAHVTPSDLVTNFYVNTVVEQDTLISEQENEPEQSSIAKKIGKIEYTTNSVENPYSLNANATNATYLEYILKLNRIGIPDEYKQSAVSAENLTVEGAEELIADGFNVEFTERNADGTAVLKISKGQKDVAYNEENLFSIAKKYEFSVKYKVIEPQGRYAGQTSGSIITDFTGYGQGYKLNENKNGITANNMEEYTYETNFVQGIIYKQYYNSLFQAGTSIYSYTVDGHNYINKSNVTGELEFEFKSSSNSYDYRPEKFKTNLYISGEKSEVEFINARGEMQTVDITDLMKLNKIEIDTSLSRDIFSTINNVNFYAVRDGEENELLGTCNLNNSEIENLKDKNVTKMYAVLDKQEGEGTIVYTQKYTVSMEDIKKIVGDDLTKINKIVRYEYGTWEYAGEYERTETKIIEGETERTVYNTNTTTNVEKVKTYIKNNSIIVKGEDSTINFRYFFSDSLSDKITLISEWGSQFMGSTSYECEHGKEYNEAKTEFLNSENYDVLKNLADSDYTLIAPKSMTIVVLDPNFDITPYQGLITIQKITDEQRKALERGEEILITTGTGDTKESFKVSGTAKATVIQFVDEKNPKTGHVIYPGDVLIDGYWIAPRTNGGIDVTRTLEETEQIVIKPYEHLYKLKTMMDIEFNGGLGIIGEFIVQMDKDHKYTTSTVTQGTTECDSYITTSQTTTVEGVEVVPTYETVTTKILEPISYTVDCSLFQVAFVNFEYEENEKISYLGMNIGDLNTSSDKTGKQTKQLTLKMNKDSSVIIGSEDKTVENVNPIIYVKMPKDFDYLVKSVEMDRNAYITIDNKLKENGEMDNGWYTTTIDGEFYIVIRCKGTYNSDLLNELNINITYKRQLNTQNPSVNQAITAYMITDDGNYIANVPNEMGLEAGDGTVPSTIYSVKSNFIVTKNMYTQLVGKVTDNEGKIRTPNITNENGNLIYQDAAKGNPLIYEKNIEIPYKAELRNNLSKINNISIVARLPQQGNESIKISGKEDTYKLLADDNLEDGKNGYVLPNEFFENRNRVGDNFVKGDVISEISLINLNNIKVYSVKQLIPTVLDSSLYTLEYSNSAIADLNTESGTNPATQFVVIADGTDLTNAKTIRVKMNSDYVLDVGSSLVLDYEMTMPDAEGMVGAIAVSRYTEVETGDVTETDSTPVYVIKGENEGTIEITKKYEGYAVGVSPENASIQNIGFKLINLETNEILINEYTDANGIIYTNAEGKALFQGVTPGDYRVIETTTNIPGYMGIEEISVSVESQQEIEVIAENKKSTGDLEIKKSWEDTNEQIGPVTFLVERVPDNTTDRLNYSVRVQTDGETGIAKLVGLPYGTYRIKEVGAQNGWFLNTNSDNDYIETIVNNPEQTQNIENKIGRGNITITKTIPDADVSNNLIEGLTFEITGYGYVNYTNKSGENVTTNYKKIVTIDETTPVVDKATGNKSAEEGISVDISDDKKTATITINDVPLGTYIVEEIEMPTIGEGEDETGRYKDLRASFNVDENGQTATVDLSNMWKYGYLTIEKTAGLLTENGQDVEIGDLSGFSVRITGTSLYGTSVDKVVLLDANGKATIALEVGDYKVEETAVDGYTTYYISEENGQEVRGVNAPTVSVVYNKKTVQKIYNQHTGEGYVKVIKTLEGVTDAQKVKLAGIQFKITGKNIAGGDVEEIINIDTIEEIDGVNYAVGKSRKISTGGEYQIEEVESTVPDYFEGIEPMAVELSTANTEQAPLELRIENKRCKGNLEMKTQTLPAGGDLVGIVYEVTEVEFDENGDYTKIEGTIREVEGSNNINDTSFAKLTDIPAGNYIVSLKTIPDGYKKDAPQIIEVPSYSTGYAYFEIIKIDEQENSSVKIEKQVLDENGEVATAQEFESAELNEKESFEVKITNVETEKVYYTFVKNGAVSEIKNLPEGTYTIEEVYKPKYTTQGYYILTEENTLEVETPITANQDKYTFTVGTAAEGTNEVSIRIKNTINTSVGFGGQEGIDNFSRYDTETIEETVVTKAIVYIVDENNVAIPGAQFKLYDANNNLVVLGTIGNTFVSNNRKLEIKGLPIGKYTLKCVAVPEGYLIPKDKEIMVYSDAVRVVRVEIKVNNPRGDIKLSTVYTENPGTPEEKEKFVSRSKYKVVDTQTGELVKFVKTLDGNYEKTNLPTGLDTISVKSGYVTLEGIEVGNYQIGLVDITDGYTIATDAPATVEVKENEEIEIKTPVKKMKIVQISVGEKRTLYLDANGDLWIIGNAGNGMAGYCNDLGESYGDIASLRGQQINFGQGVKISKFAQGKCMGIAIDTTGKVWTWGSANYDNAVGVMGAEDNKIYLTCLSEQEGNPLNDIIKQEPDFKIIDVSAQYESAVALDNKGRVWRWGYNGCELPTCISMQEENELHDIKVSKLGEQSQAYDMKFIDSDGRVWIYYSNSNYKCISDEYSEPLYGVNIVKISNNIAMDDAGNVWTGLKTENPTMIESSKFNNAKIIDVQDASDYYNSRYFVLDESGKIWGWGYNYNGYLGTGNTENDTIENPTCLQETETQPLFGRKIVQISAAMQGGHIIALDSENYLWGWGDNDGLGELGNTKEYDITQPINIPIIYNERFDYNLKFADIKYMSSTYATIILDDFGQVWGCGQSIGSGLGYLYRNDNLRMIPELINIGSKVVKIETTYDSALVLDENGYIYHWGYYGDLLGSSTEIPLKLSDDYFENNKIIDICANQRSGLALDEKGQVWELGAIPKKVEFRYSNGIVCNKKMTKIQNTYHSKMSIDEDGKVWTWGDTYYVGVSELYRTTVLNSSTTDPICLSEIPGNSLQTAYENNIRFISGYGSYYKNALIDNSGKLWISTYNKEFVCVSDIEISPIYQSDSEYKIISISAPNNGYDTFSMIDSNGDMWNISSAQNIEDMKITKVNVQGSLYENMKAKKYYNYDNGNIRIIDEDGKIWTGGDNSYGQLGDGTKIFRDLVCLYEGTYNILYNTKTTDIISNKFIETENGKIYNITSGIVYYMEGSKYIEENNLGTIKQVEYLNYVPSSSWNPEKLFAIAIDEAGKVWTWGEAENSELFGDEKYSNARRTIPQCISDITTNPLYLAKQANPNFKIVSIKINDNLKYITATDNSGKTWVWGYNMPKTYMGATKTNIPFCINGEGTALEGKSIDSIWFNYSNIIILSEGKVYTAGLTTGIIGDIVAKPTLSAVSDNNGELTGIENVIVENQCVIAYSNTAVWTWGNNYYGTAGTGNNTIQNIPVKILDNINVKDIYCNDYSCVVLDENGKVWTWGYNTTYGTLGYTPEQNYTTPVCISDDTTSPLYGKVITELIEIPLERSIAAKDSTGTIWGWGYRLQVLPTNLMEKYNTQLTSLFGTANNENTEQLVRGLNTGYIYYNNQVYTIELDRYGNISECLHRQGELVGKTLTKVCKTKAIDNEGNLYVWKTDTGIGTDVTNPVCVTTIEKLTEPVFTEGWTKIQKQH